MTPDEKTVFAGGSFDEIGGATRYNIAALDAETGAARPWAPNTEGSVFALALSPDGDTLSVGGSFFVIAGQRRRNLAEFDTLSMLMVTANIGPNGGTLVSPYDSTTYTVPAGAFTDTVTLSHTPYRAWRLPSTGALASTQHAFEVTAVFSSTQQPAQIVAGQTITVTVDPLERGPLVPDTLNLWWCDETSQAWSQSGITSSVDPDGSRLSAQVEHFTLFAVLGETKRVYLPLVLR